MDKKLLSIIIILILLGLALKSSIRNYFDYIKWSYTLPSRYTYTSLSQSNNYLIASAVDGGKKYSEINILKKDLSKESISIKLPGELNQLVTDKNYAIVSTTVTKKAGIGNLFVFDLQTADLIWKEKYLTKFWNFITYSDYMLFLNRESRLTYVKWKNRNRLWSLNMDIDLNKSLKPAIINNKIYLCNEKMLIMIDARNAKALPYLRPPERIKSCQFKGKFGAILLNNDMIIVLDLDKIRIPWMHKVTTLFSKNFIDIVNLQYLVITNVKDLSKVKITKNTKIVKPEDTVMYVMDLFTGKVLWQKSLLKATDFKNYPTYFTVNAAVLPGKKDNFSVYNFDNGKLLWNFTNPDQKQSSFTYLINGNNIYLFLLQNSSYLVYIIDLANGKYINKIDVPLCKTLETTPVMDENNIYMLCNNNQLMALEYSKLLNKDKQK